MGVLSSSFPETWWFQQQNIHAGIIDGIFMGYHGIVMVRREMMRHGRKDNARMIQAIVFPPTSCEKLPSRQPNIFDRTMELRFRIILRTRGPMLIGQRKREAEVQRDEANKGAERSRRGAAAHGCRRWDKLKWNGVSWELCWTWRLHGDITNYEHHEIWPTHSCIMGMQWGLFCGIYKQQHLAWKWLVGTHPFCGWWCQWIGSRENLPEISPYFMGKIHGFRLRFSLQPIFSGKNSLQPIHWSCWLAKSSRCQTVRFVAAPSAFSGAAAIEAQRLDHTGACENAGFHQQETGIEWTHLVMVGLAKRKIDL